MRDLLRNSECLSDEWGVFKTEAVNTSWSSRMDMVDRLAQLGFIVITVGNRGGHPARSKWYHNCGYGNLRDYGLEDKKVVIEKLAAKHKFIDINKVGIHGHSGGGVMSTAAMLVYPDFFNTLRVVDALIKANKRFDMLMLPGQRHSFGSMTEYFFWRMADYFSEHLIGDYRKEVEIPQMNNN